MGGADLNHSGIVTAALVARTVAALLEEAVRGHVDGVGHVAGNVKQHVAVALHGGLVPVTSTYLVFANYMMPSMRMASVMNLPVIFTFCHASVYEVRDGVTHIPVEHLDQLRLIPNLTTFRVYDMAECKAAYDWFYLNKKPMCLCVSKVATEQVLSSEDMTGGAYFLTQDKAKINIISSGADIQIALELKNALDKEEIVANVISMLSMEVFDKQPKKFKSKFFNKPTIIIETSTAVKYFKYVDESHIFNVTKHGVSGDSASIKQYYGFDIKTLVEKVKKLLK